MGILFPDVPAVLLWLQTKHPLHVIHILKNYTSIPGQVSPVGLKKESGTVGSEESSRITDLVFLLP